MPMNTNMIINVINNLILGSILLCFDSIQKYMFILENDGI